MDFIKIKTRAYKKSLLQKIEQFTNYKPNKGLVSRIHNKILQIKKIKWQTTN